MHPDLGSPACQMSGYKDLKYVEAQQRVLHTALKAVYSSTSCVATLLNTKHPARSLLISMNRVISYVIANI